MTNFTDLHVGTFRFLNEIFGKPAYDNIMIAAHIIAHPDYFIYVLAVIMIIASIMLYRIKHDAIMFKELCISWLTIISAMGISLIFLDTVVGALKLYTSVNRPFCSLENIYTLEKITTMEKCNRSFPSGHTSIVTIVVASFWPLLNRPFKIIATFIALVVAISRIASGAHYPMDLIGSVIICLPLTIYIRNKVKQIITHYYSKTKILDIICEKLRKIIH